MIQSQLLSATCVAMLMTCQSQSMTLEQLEALQTDLQSQLSNVSSQLQALKFKQHVSLESCVPACKTDGQRIIVIIEVRCRKFTVVIC